MCYTNVDRRLKRERIAIFFRKPGDPAACRPGLFSLNQILKCFTTLQRVAESSIVTLYFIARAFMTMNWPTNWPKALL